MSKGWIAVDLDGTLAEYDGWRGETWIGRPIPLMLARVKAWLAAGKTVKIFTARVGRTDPDELAAVLGAVQRWCIEHVGQSLEVTATKDYSMIELWDDRCIQVVTNTGRRADGLDEIN
jgi:hypothetical protein